MFNIGDKVVYPMHGAGIIESVEEVVLDGCCQKYYVMLIPMGNLRIKIAASKASNAGLRCVHDKDKLLECIRTAQCPCKDRGAPGSNWNQRYKDNLERIRSGKMEELAVVFRSLLQREQERGLSSVEKKMLQNVRQIILSELILSQNIEHAEAENLLANVVN